MKLTDIPAALRRVREAGQYREIRDLRMTGASRGLSRDGREVLVFNSNDYLGMTHEAAVIRAAGEALRFGAGPLAIPLYNKCFPHRPSQDGRVPRRPAQIDAGRSFSEGLFQEGPGSRGPAVPLKQQATAALSRVKLHTARSLFRLKSPEPFEPSSPPI